MERTELEAWLEAYGRAWQGRDPQAAAKLFAEDGTYQVTPFVEPLRGRAAILAYWTEVARTEENVQFAFEVLAVTDRSGMAHWWASFVIVPQMLQTKLDGVFLISFDAAGRCISLCEWWHKDQHAIAAA